MAHGVEALVDMFPGLPVRDVFEQTGQCSDKALEALLALSGGSGGAPMEGHWQAGSPPKATSQDLHACFFPPENRPERGGLVGEQVPTKPSTPLPFKKYQPPCTRLAPASPLAARGGRGPHPGCRTWWPLWPGNGPQPPTHTMSVAAMVGHHQGQLPCEQGWGRALEGSLEGLALASPLVGAPSAPAWPEAEAGLHDSCAARHWASESASVTTFESVLDSGYESSSTGEPAPLTEQDVMGAVSVEEALPHLAPFLCSPSPSGTCSPTTGAVTPPHRGLRSVPGSLAAAVEAAATATTTAGNASEGRRGYSATELLAAVEFHCGMFPALKKEVVADVLQRYSDNPETALEQLAMLSHCLEESQRSAASSPTSSSAGCRPDHSAWETGSGFSSGGEEDEVGGKDKDEGQLLLVAECLSREERLEALKLEFPSASAADVTGALDACSGSLAAAADLLRVVVADVASTTAPTQAQAQPMPVPVPLPLPATPAPAAEPGSVSTASMAALKSLFPVTSDEALQVAMAACDGNVREASKLLKEQAGAIMAPASTNTNTNNTNNTTSTSLVNSGIKFSTSGPAAVAVKAVAPAVVVPGATANPHHLHNNNYNQTRRQTSPPRRPAASLAEATYLRNQAIYEQERVQEERLRQAYTKCFELARAAFDRGDQQTADDLHEQGHTYRRLFREEQAKATRRISRRINSGNLKSIEVDLHGLHVDAALALVAEGVRTLPSVIPSGVVVKYITGRGAHSSEGGAKIRPAVLELLAEKGIPIVEGPGFVEATLLPPSE